MTHIESWKDQSIQGHRFQGYVSDRDLAMQPAEVIARVKTELVREIVAQVMEEIGPKLDKALREIYGNQLHGPD